MTKKTCLLLIGMYLTGIVGIVGAKTISSDRLLDQLHGMWLGTCMANWTGLQTECSRTTAPFHIMADSNATRLVFNSIWGADDDTDVEYVYLYLMGIFGPDLTANQLKDAYVKHITRYIWNATQFVRDFAGQGIPLPFAAQFNARPLWISDQLKTELFGAVSPGMVGRALDIAAISITTRSFAAHASQFYQAMFAAAATVDTTMTPAQQMEALVRIGRSVVPNTSKAADCIDFVLNDYLNNANKRNWESTRDKIYIRYQRDAALNGFRYLDCAESSINLAAGVLCALYGAGDYKNTVWIGSLAGWDSDNQPANLGGLVGLLYGHRKLRAYLLDMYPGRTIGELYNARRTRDSLPDYLPGDPNADDSLIFMARRSLAVAERNIIVAGGSIDSTSVLGKRLYVLPVDSGVNHLFIRYQQSLNNQVRLAGGKVKASSGGADSIPLICDACENEWSGTTAEADRCYKGTVGYYTSPATAGKTEEWYSVTYDRKVVVNGAMLYTGPLTNAGGFSSLFIDVWNNNGWTAVQNVKLPAFSAETAWQVLTATFAPVECYGLRVRGTISGKNTSTTVTELDAMGAIAGAVDASGRSLIPKTGRQHTMTKYLFISNSKPHAKATIVDIRGRITQAHQRSGSKSGLAQGVYIVHENRTK